MIQSSKWKKYQIIIYGVLANEDDKIHDLDIFV